MKTELQKVLSVAGKSGLYLWIAQARGGVVVESMDAAKKRMWLGPSAQLSSLSEIYIYTEEGQMKIREVFEAMKAHLGDAPAPDAKAAPEVLEDFFRTVAPNYDGDRFYVSHMRKVVNWYKALADAQALDFAPEEEAQEAQEAAAE